MKKKIFYCGVIFFLAWVCLSLGWHNHRIQPLSSIATVVIPVFDPTEKTVDIQVKSLSPEESQKLLGYDLPSKGIQPLQITIQNNSPYQYSLCPASVDM